MKKFLLSAGIAVAVASCTTDITSLNVNPKAPEQVPAGALIANATVSLTDYLASINVNLNNFNLWAQHITETTYTDEANFDYDNRDVNGNTFDRLYTDVLRDLQEAEKAVDADINLTAAQKEQQHAVIDVLEVYTYHVLVDIFGDVPYTEALSAATVVPAYDKGEDIYTDLAARLTADIAVLGGDNGLGSYDLLYGGNSDGWKKFASSLLLKLAVRVADHNLATATSWGAAALAGGVILDPADAATLHYASAPPHTNPLWDDLVQSGRSDFIAANTLGDVMNTLNDPRRAIYFRNNNSDGTVNGAPYGLASSYALFSQPGNALEDPTLAHTLIDHVEVHFLLADAAARGVTIPGATAEGLYQAAVTASIVGWGGSAADAATYLAQSSVAWDANNWKSRLGTQKWISLFTRGNEAWAAQRQYDLPMNVAAEAQRVTPKRMSYGVDEYALNNANVTAAGANYQGDKDTAPIFWDKN